MQQGSFRFPDNCPDADCDFLVTYQASGDNSVVFELRGRGNWAGVGFSGDNQMVSNLNLILRINLSVEAGHIKEVVKDGCVMSKFLASINSINRGCFLRVFQWFGGTRG